MRQEVGETCNNFPASSAHSLDLNKARPTDHFHLRLREAAENHLGNSRSLKATGDPDQPATAAADEERGQQHTHLRNPPDRPPVLITGHDTFCLFSPHT